MILHMHVCRKYQSILSFPGIFFAEIYYEWTKMSTSKLSNEKMDGTVYMNICIEKNTSNLCLNFFHLLARQPNLEKNYIYSNKFFHNFYLSDSKLTCPGLQASWLVRRLHQLLNPGLLDSQGKAICKSKVVF